MHRFGRGAEIARTDWTALAIVAGMTIVDEEVGVLLMSCCV